MDKTVKRVTVLEGEREGRQAKVVYDDPKVDESKIPPVERAIRHVVNAALITAQVAYDSYLKRASEGKTNWLFQSPPEEDSTSSTTSVRTTIDHDETLPGTRIP